MVKERYEPKGEVIISSLPELFSQLASTLKNYPFLIFIAAETIFTLGFFIIQIVLPDFNSVILHRGEGFVTILFIPFLLVCFPLLFVVEPSVKKWNKKVAYAGGLLGFALLFPFLGIIGILPNKEITVLLLLILIGIAGAPQALKYVMPGAMLGEIIDYDERLTGRRREAIYSGAIGFATKTAMTLSYFIRWAVYTPFGRFSIDNPRPVLLIGPVTGVICLIGFFIFLRYPILHVVRGE